MRKEAEELYPSDLGLLPWGKPTDEDAEKALNIARSILGWGRKIKK